jgi:hypothetical protein
MFWLVSIHVASFNFKLPAAFGLIKMLGELKINNCRHSYNQSPRPEFPKTLEPICDFLPTSA